MNFDELRATIEAISCHREVPAQQKREAIDVLATLERQYAERERRLRKEVLKPLDLGAPFGDIIEYSRHHTEHAHRKLAEILDSSQ